jgi:hypothetical protein
MLAPALVASGCGFDTTAAGGGGAAGFDAAPDHGGAGAAGADAAIDAPGGDGAPDSGPCPTADADILVDNMVWTSDTIPRAIGNVGDSVALQARVCTRSGRGNVVWSFSAASAPGDLRLGAGPTATAFATAPGELHIHLHLVDPITGDTFDRTVFAERALGPRFLAANTSSPGSRFINQLSAGANKLWVATNDGPWTVALAPPHTPWTDLRVSIGSNFVGTGQAAVFFDNTDNLVWFGGKGLQLAVSKVRLNPPGVDRVDVSVAAGGGTSVRGFSSALGGLFLVCDRGVFAWASNGIGFVDPSFGMVNDSNLWALGAGLSTLWAGGHDLEGFSSNSQSAQDPFGSPDDRIRGVAVDPTNGAWVWLGSDGMGAGRFDTAAGTMEEQLTTQSAAHPLPGDHVRDLALDDADVWIATDQGLARYKRDAIAVVDYRVSDGGTALTAAQLSTHAVVVDRSTGLRRVFVGTEDGVYVLEAP